MGEVVPIVPAPAAVDAAWERYAALQSPIVNGDHALLLDRPYQEELLRAHRDFKRLFLASDQRKPADAPVSRT